VAAPALWAEYFRVVDRFGSGGEEMEARHRYEQALRDVNILVLAPTDERKHLAHKSFEDTEGTSSTSLAVCRSSSSFKA